MAILPVTLDDIESLSTITNPNRTYISGSGGVTGSINIFPRGSKIEKEIRPLENFQQSYLSDDDIEALREDMAAAAVNLVQAGQPILRPVNVYLNKVAEQTQSAKKQKTIEINRYTPSFSFTANTVRKLQIKELLMPYYRSLYPTMDWAYANYNSLNFFTSSCVPTSSVLLYPNINNDELPEHIGYISGTYALSGAFSFDFYINPRYRQSAPTEEFNAGTIFHLSSSYALSLITGSKKDHKGLPSSFRLQLQLSHSADISPSVASSGNYPNNLIFLSDEDSLEFNKWHRVVVRWGTNLVNDGTGSFNIDGVDKGIFVIPSGTISPHVFSTKDNPTVLSLGNYYEGSNSLLDSQAIFFADVPAQREGLVQLIDNGATQDEPTNYFFRHPLNAELHDVAIKRHYMTDAEINKTYGRGTSSLDKSDLAFYVPALFSEHTPIRKRTTFPAGSTYGGILQTPFFEIDGSTDDPFNVAMAFGVGGHYINLENFVKDFANDTWPRLHHLSGTAITYTTTARSANDFLYDDERVRKRNLTILPCDDGNYIPNYLIVADEIGNKYVDAFGRYDPSLINLDNLLNQSSLVVGSIFDAEKHPEFIKDLIGFSPEEPGLPPGTAVLLNKNNIEEIISTDPGAYGPGVQKNMPLVIYQRTKDPSSDQITFFDISNIFYGKRIQPGTFTISDASVTGSAGAVKLTLKDDGAGGLYRADSVGQHSAWNNVGNIFYDEGVVVIKSPHLYFFGKDGYEMSFRGEQNIHTLKYEVLAPYGLLNSSSNPTYAPIKSEIKPSEDPVDDDIFVYISNINFHDDNLNVVAKASLAQPVIKRETEKLLFKISFDF